MDILAYVGTKRVKAAPMNRAEYGAYRGWGVPDDENPAEEGYLVEYLDSQKPNHPKHKGYISWCPKDVFERTYKRVGETSRVTEEDVENAIVGEHYFTARHGCNGAIEAGEFFGRERPRHGVDHLAPLDLLTFCVLVLRNGYTVVGTSACVSPENFDAAIGRKVAREDAVGKVWPLLGYALKDRLVQSAESF